MIFGERAVIFRSCLSNLINDSYCHFSPLKALPQILPTFPWGPCWPRTNRQPRLSNWWLLPGGRIRPATSDLGDELPVWPNPPLISWPNLPHVRGRTASLRKWKCMGSSLWQHFQSPNPRKETWGSDLIYKPFLMRNKCCGCELILNHKNPCLTLSRIKYHI